MPAKAGIQYTPTGWSITKVGVYWIIRFRG